MGRHLSDVPENWVYDTSRLSQRDVCGILENINAEQKEILTPCEVLVLPRRGQSRFLRYILANIFKRVPGPKARNILVKHEAAKK